MANGSGNGYPNRLDATTNKKIAAFLAAAGLTDSEAKTVLGDRELSVKCIYYAQSFNNAVRDLVLRAHAVNPKLRLFTKLCQSCFKKYNVDGADKRTCGHCGHVNRE